MKTWKFISLGLVLAGWFAGLAWGQTHLPKGLEGLIPNYPEATVVFSKDWDGSSRAIMETDDDPDAVMVTYRKSLVWQGWRILTGIELNRGKCIVFSKGDKILQILSKGFKEKNTTIFVSIYK
jgi:hypothetical protein